MANDVLDIYENVIIARWKTYFEQGVKQQQKDPIWSLFSLLLDLEAEFFYPGNSIVNIITVGGKFSLAEAFTRSPNDKSISINPLELGEYRGKDASPNLLDSFIKYLSDSFEKKYRSKLDTIRIFDEQIVRTYADLLSKCNNRSDHSIPNESILSFLNTCMNDLIAGKLIQHPEPPLTKFLKNLTTTYPDLLSKILPFLLGKMHISRSTIFLLDGIHTSIPLKIIPTPSGGEIEFLPEISSIPGNWEERQGFLRKIQLLHKAHQVIYLRKQEIYTFIKEVVMTPVPLDEARLIVLGERFLYFFKNYGENWLASPKPLIINTFNRYITKSLGFNFNIQKLAYWDIPTAITRILTQITGGSGSLLCVCHSRSNIPAGNGISAYSIQIEDSRIKGIEPLGATLSSSISDSLKDLSHIPENAPWNFLLAHESISNVKSIIFVSQEFFKILLGDLFSSGLSLHPLTLLTVSKKISRLKDPLHFYIYPETAGFQALRKLRGIHFLRLLSQLCFDRFEF